MGSDFSYVLLFDRDKVWDILQYISSFARKDHEIEVLIENDGRLVLPFTSNLKSEPILYSGQRLLEFDTVLFFEVDDAIIEYYEDNKRYDFEHEKRSAQKKYIEENDRTIATGNNFAIGYIYLNISFGKKYVKFRFTAATSHMSMLFLHSKSIGNRYIDVLRHYNGYFCILDLEGDAELFYIVGRELKRKPLDWSEWGDLDPDELVEKLKVLSSKQD